uniref:TATA-box binding protein associated factor 9 n=1 Tax=Apteryx owenii TaxID=8824 RepID=A0A8B9PWH4_APTOW
MAPGGSAHVNAEWEKGMVPFRAFPGWRFHCQSLNLILKKAVWWYVTTILEDAKIYSSHAKKSSVDADDVRLAIQCRTDQSFTSPPPRDFLLDIARQKNQTPLPLIKPYSGPRLPPDRYCLTAPNYRLKSLQKKVSSSAGRITVPRLSVGAVSSRPSTPTLGTPSAQTVSVSTKVGTPVSLTGQRFTVQIPSSQATVKSDLNRNGQKLVTVAQEHSLHVSSVACISDGSVCGFADW